MGGGQSNLAQKNFDRQESCQSVESIDISIVQDVLIDILSFVPYKDLLCNCRLVCSDWKEIVDGHSVWLRKCENVGIKIPKCKINQVPRNYYQYVFIYMQTKRNFLKNPCGEENLRHWTILEQGGHGFAIEHPPAGAKAVPSDVGSQRCFATSYVECKKYQIVDLHENANNKHLLMNGIVNIKVGDWWAARFDCACVYNLRVTLFDNSNCEVDEFIYKTSEEQWNGQEWHLVTHTFNSVSSVRFVRFEHSGKDRQFWAGHYGSKMTGAFVEFELAI